MYETVVYSQTAHRGPDLLLGGENVGHAAKRAREAVKSGHDLRWLAYTVFADPLATVRWLG
jgi:hypothetical protein